MSLVIRVISNKESRLSLGFFPKLNLGTVNSDGTLSGGKLGTYLQELEDWNTAYEELEMARAEGMSDADYQARLEEIEAGINTTLTNINALGNEVLDYYGNALAAAGEEMAFFTD